MTGASFWRRFREPRYPAAVLVMFLAFLPLTAGWAYKAFVHPRPFWIHYYDPEEIYFYGGLKLLKGEAPGNVDNPGIPLHLLSAALLAPTDRSPMALDRFRAAGYAAAWFLTLAAGWLLLRTLLAGLPLLLQVAALWTYYLSGMSLRYETIWSPEILYFPAGGLVLACFWRCYDRLGKFRDLLWTGLALGLACALKFTFLAWAAAMPAAVAAFPPAGAKRLRAAAALAAAEAAGFCLATGMGIFGYPRMWARIRELAGESGWPAAGGMLGSLFRMLSSEKAWSLWLLGSLGAILFYFWRSRRSGRPGPAGAAGMTAFAVLAAVFSGLLALRMMPPPWADMEPRYLLANGLCGVLLCAWAGRLLWARQSRTVQAGVLIMAAALLGRNMYADLRMHRSLIAAGTAERAEVDAAVRSCAAPGRPPVVIYGWRSSRPSFALRMLARDPDMQARISREFPEEGYVSWSGRIVPPDGKTRWDLLVIAPEQLARLREAVGPVLAAGKRGYLIVAAPRAGQPGSP